MAQQPKQVRIDQLPPQQLAGLKQQLEEELQGLQQSAVTLQNVASEFHQSGEAIQHLAEQKVGAQNRIHVSAPSAGSSACTAARSGQHASCH